MGIEALFFFLLIFGLGFLFLDSEKKAPSLLGPKANWTSHDNVRPLRPPRLTLIKSDTPKRPNLHQLLGELSAVMGSTAVKAAVSMDPDLGKVIRVSRTVSGTWFITGRKGKSRKADRAVLKLKDMPFHLFSLTELEQRYPQLAGRGGRILLAESGIYSRLPSGRLIQLV